MIDLHCHSTVSDGALSPTQVVQLAHKNGCTLLALTDHDHTGGLYEARQAAQALGMLFINGVEISTTWRGRTIHIVGLDFDIDNLILQNLLARLRSGRIERLAKIVDKLEKKGIKGAFEGALSLASNREMVSRTHLADWLVQQGYARNKQNAFIKYLGDGKCAAVKHEWATLDEVVHAILTANGLAIVAHPMRYTLSTGARRSLLEEFSHLGGQGMEVHSGNCNLNDRVNYALLAQHYNLFASVGSDFHRLNDFSGGTLGVCPSLPVICQPIWTQFRSTK